MKIIIIFVEEALQNVRGSSLVDCSYPKLSLFRGSDFAIYSYFDCDKVVQARTLHLLTEKVSCNGIGSVGSAVFICILISFKFIDKL